MFRRSDVFLFITTLLSSREILKKYWGYDSFRPQQEEIISSVIAGKDTLAVLPTGGGKSLCYQIPAMLQSGVCVVVEPLISLIKDQIDNLKRVGINAVTVNSLQSVDRNIAALNQLYNYRSKFLFIAAERLQNKDFLFQNICYQYGICTFKTIYYTTSVGRLKQLNKFSCFIRCFLSIQGNIPPIETADKYVRILHLQTLYNILSDP